MNSIKNKCLIKFFTSVISCETRSVKFNGSEVVERLFGSLKNRE